MLRRLLPAAALLALAVPAAASAAPGPVVLPPETVEAHGTPWYLDGTEAALLPDGRTLVLWTEGVPVGEPGPWQTSAWRVRVALRSPGGGWTSRTLSEGTDDDRDEFAALGVGAGGDVVVVHHRAGDVVARRMRADGSWTPAVALARPAGATARWPRVAVAADGRAAVAYTTTQGTGDAAVTEVRAAVLPAGDGAPEGTVLATAAAADREAVDRWPAIAVDDAGRVTAQWLRHRWTADKPATHTLAVETARRAGAAWGLSEVVVAPTTRDVRSPALAATGDRTAALLLQDGFPTLLVRDGDAAWRKVPVDAPLGDGGIEPVLQLRPDGAALGGWIGAGDVHVLRAGPAAADAYAERVADTDDARHVDVAFAGDRALVAWQDWKAGIDEIALATAPGVGGAFTTRSLTRTVEHEDLAEGPWLPSLAGEPGGDAAVAWTWNDNDAATHGAVRLVPVDATAPELRALTVPEAGAGTFAVTPHDRFGPATVQWSFGAALASVEHAFTAPGPHEVAVTARDAAGHEARAARTVTVPAPQPEPEPEDRAPEPPTAPAPAPPAPVPGPPAATPPTLGPQLSVSLARRLDRRGRLTVTVRGDRPSRGRVTVTVQAGKRRATLGRAAYRLTRPGKVVLRVRASAAARKLLRAKGARLVASTR